MLDHYTFRRKLTFLVGFYPGMLLSTLKGIPRFILDLRKYQRLNSKPVFRATLRDLFPILVDRGASAGAASGHYFHQDLWAARKIHKQLPQSHMDIGSRVDGFVAHLLVFMSVTILDIRQLSSKVEGMSFIRDDATKLLQIPDGSLFSLSSLHAAEHFGLGRYSDPIDPLACFEFMTALQRVLAVGGRLYFSVPVGRERVEFNAHRIFAPATILNSFSKLSLVSFSYVGDDGDLYENADILDAAQCEYGCGLFEFMKLS
jgi:hypothetical protein